MDDTGKLNEYDKDELLDIAIEYDIKIPCKAGKDDIINIILEYFDNENLYIQDIISPELTTVKEITRELEDINDIDLFSIFSLDENKEVCKNFWEAIEIDTGRTRIGNTKVLLGKGARGTVYLYDDPLFGDLSMPVVVKYSSISPENRRLEVIDRQGNLIKINEYVSYTTEQLKNILSQPKIKNTERIVLSPNALNEVIMASILSNFYNEGYSINYTFYKAFFICKDFKPQYEINRGWKAFSVLEEVSGTLYDSLKQENILHPYIINPDTVKSLLFQGFFTIFTMQKLDKICHYDLHYKNIFFKLMNPDETYNGMDIYNTPYLKYFFNGTSYYLPNYKILYKMADLDFACKYSKPLVMLDFVYRSQPNNYHYAPYYQPGYDPLTFYNSFKYIVKQLYYDGYISSYNKNAIINIFSTIDTTIAGIIHLYETTYINYNGSFRISVNDTKIINSNDFIYNPVNKYKNLGDYIPSKPLPNGINIPKLDPNNIIIPCARPNYKYGFMYFDYILSSPIFDDYINNIPNDFVEVGFIN